MSDRGADGGSVAVQPAVRSVAWQPPRPLPLEVLTLRSLRDRGGGHELDVIEQVGFPVIMLVANGEGTHMVDFDQVPLRPGRVVALLPGQIHRWPSAPELTATLLLSPDLPPFAAQGPGPLIRDLDPGQVRRVHLLLTDVQRETGADRPRAATWIALRALRDLLWVTMGLVTAESAASEREPFLAFRDDIEALLLAGHSVESRARRLGYSARTIDRACRAATGQSAKQLLDARLALQARRLLALPGATSAAVGERLGFTEATNFTKFLTRVTGRTPTQWRLAAGCP